MALSIGRSWVALAVAVVVWLAAGTGRAGILVEFENVSLATAGCSKLT